MKILLRCSFKMEECVVDFTVRAVALLRLHVEFRQSMHVHIVFF